MTLVFEAYDEAVARKALHKVASACAYTLLLRAFNESQEKPAGGDKWTAWKQLARIRTALDAVAVERTTLIPGLCPSCQAAGEVREVEYAVLNPEGGTVALDTADVERLQVTFERWAKEQKESLALSIDATFRWLALQQAAQSSTGVAATAAV